MVSTRSRKSLAATAAATSIPAARALRKDRRARQAEAEILGDADPFKKPSGRKRGRKARIPPASGSQLEPVREEAAPQLLGTPPPLSQQSAAAVPLSQGAGPTRFGPPQSQVTQSHAASPHSQAAWPMNLGPSQSQTRLGETPPPLSQQSNADPPNSQGAWPGNFAPPHSQARLRETPPPPSQQSNAGRPHSQAGWPTQYGPPQSQGPLGETPPLSQQSNAAPPNSQEASKTHLGPNQSLTANWWFGSRSSVDTAVALGPFQTIDNLYSFASDLHTVPEPTSPKTVPADGERHSKDVKKQVAAVAKVAEVVLACMNGKRPERSDLLTIIDVMLADPEIQSKLPPGLRALCARTVAGRENADLETQLIDSFVHATERSICLVEKLYGITRGAKNKLLRNSNQMGSWTFTPTGDPQQAGSSQQEQLAGMPPLLQSLKEQPLTEANLMRCVSGSSKGKAKEGRSGVVRTGRGAVRSSPYPRRASGDTRVSIGSQGAANEVEKLEDGSFSVYSASTGRPHRRPVNKELLAAIFEQPETDGQFDARIYENPTMLRALALLDTVREESGMDEVKDVFKAYEQLALYKMLGSFSSDLMSEAYLEYSSQPLKLSDESLQFKGKEQLASMPFGIELPPNQVITNDPTLGSGVISFRPFFTPR